MTNSQLKRILAESGLPVVYHAWPPKRAPEPPYVVFLRTQTAEFYADGKVYFRKSRYRAELYTDQKAPAVEVQLERTLDAAGILWKITDEAFLDEEGLYEILYEIEV